MVELLNIDCMEYMAGLPDKAFDLAIVDPPYGIGASDYKRGGTKYGKSFAKCKVYSKKNWDFKKPSPEFIKELKRVSKNQIIFGANHFIESINKDSPSWIVWDKDNGEGSGYADCELPWTSFPTAVRRFKYRWAGMLQEKMGDLKEERIHQTQKPIALYAWILKKYANEGDRILDTHGGSMSSAIAAQKLGFDMVLCEIDEEHFDKGVKRFKIETANPLFEQPNFVTQSKLL